MCEVSGARGMTDRVTLIFGAGFSGRAYGTLLVGEGERVFGTTRTTEKASVLKDIGIEPLIFDGNAVSAQLEATINAATHVIVSAAPTETGDPVLKAAELHLANAPKLQWMAYLSTVGVYGNHDGEWVDENAMPRPVSQRSVQRLAAEQAWRAFADRHARPLAILRLSGIYGPGRNAFVTLEEGRARRLVKPGQVFNRIHVDDIARGLAFLAESHANGIFNITDEMPAPPQDVVAFAASVMKIDPPPETDFETATLSPMARSFYGENKRVSNRRIKDLGFTFDWPDYRTALRRMWAEQSWQKPTN